VLALISTVIAGCDGAPSKAGGPPAPVVLTLASGDASLQYHPSIQRFLALVPELSHGELRVEGRFEVGHFAPDRDQVVMRQVAAGDAELGYVPTAGSGVPGLEALNTPMLIDSYALLKAIVASDAAKQQLQQFNDVVGIAVMPNLFSRPVGVKHSFRGPDDYRGAVFGAVVGHGVGTALGFRPVTTFGPDRDQLIADGRLDGFPCTLTGYPLNNFAGRANHVTLNVPFGSATTALIGNPGAVSKLTEKQRQWIQEAARRAGAEFDPAVTESEAIQVLCSQGVELALATPDQLAALRMAMQPVFSDLAKDPNTGPLVRTVEELRTTLPADPAPASCR
jgi:TRAP-type C4-dicarboxylate transport system substrate-binding protein